MSDDVIKNPNRGATKHSVQAEPEWVRLDKKPIKMERRIAPSILAPKKQPEQESTSVEDALLDNNGQEIKIDQNHFIDNNDWVFPPDSTDQLVQEKRATAAQARWEHEEKANYGTETLREEFRQRLYGDSADRTKTTTNQIAPILGQPRVGEYILMVFGKIVDTGLIEQIEGVARSILYGENEQYLGTEVKADDIIVLKRIGINVGIFIDRN